MYEPVLTVPKSFKPKEAGRQMITSQDIWERDNHTCQYCGMVSHRYQEVNNLNGNHQDSRADNMVTICPLCHGCFHLDSRKLNGTALLVYLPQVKQADLNNLLRAAFVAIRRGTAENKTRAIGALKALEAHARPVEKAWGTSSPFEFGNVLQRASHGAFAKHRIVMEGLKLVYRPKFINPVVLDYWIDTQFQKENDLSCWRLLYDGAFPLVKP